MTLRWGPGPVFAYECRTSARRWQLFALRTLAASLPGIALALVCWATLDGRLLTISNLASTGESFFYALVGTQLALILLAAPAYTAGAICLDKERGTLLHMLATDLSNAEIILGKLAVRLLAVTGLVAAAVPVLFGAILLGGIEPAAAVGALLVSLGVAVLTSTLALTLSVWMRKTYEVLLIVYFLLVVILLLLPIWTVLRHVWGLSPLPDGVKMINPFWLAYLPYLRPGTPCLSEQAVFLGVALAVSALLTVVTVLRVRAVAVHQVGRVQRRRSWLSPWFLLWRWLPGPSLDGNPVLWREWHRKRPSRWSLLAWFLYGGMAYLLSLLVIVESLDSGRVRDLAALVNALQVTIGLLLLSIASVTALAEERVRGSLDVLLATPLSTLQIVQGKWWGAYRPIFLLAVPPGLVAVATVATAHRSGTWWGVPLLVALILAYGATLTGLGLALATWISRPSHAQVWSVILLVLITVVPVMPLFFFHRLSDMEDFALASPFYGIGALTDQLAHPRRSREEEVLVWSCIWLVVYAGAAVVFFMLILRTFDRCLGRARQRMKQSG